MLNPIDKDKDETGRYILLPSEWTLWEHRSDSKNWKIDGYKKIIKIGTIGQFWNVMNTFYKLDHKGYDFFFMKNKVLPIWEDDKNKKGSQCSIRTDLVTGIDALNLLFIQMVTNKLYTDGTDDINGISCSVRNSWIVIKIWCGFREDKLTTIIKNVLGKLTNLTFKYIPTSPEY